MLSECIGGAFWSRSGSLSTAVKTKSMAIKRPNSTRKKIEQIDEIDTKSLLEDVF